MYAHVGIKLYYLCVGGATVQTIEIKLTRSRKVGIKFRGLRKLFSRIILDLLKKFSAVAKHVCCTAGPRYRDEFAFDT